MIYGWLASPCTAASTSLCLSRENAQEQGLEEGEVGEVGCDWAMMSNTGNTVDDDDGDDDDGDDDGVVRLSASLMNCSLGLVAHRSSSSLREQTNEQTNKQTDDQIINRSMNQSIQ